MECLTQHFLCLVFFLTDRFLCTCFCSSTGTAGTKHSSSEKPTHVYENTMFPTPTPTVTMWNFRAVETNTNTDWTLVLCNPPPRYRCILQRAGDFTVAKKKKNTKKFQTCSHHISSDCFVFFSRNYRNMNPVRRPWLLSRTSDGKLE